MPNILYICRCEIEYSLFEKFQENEQKKIYTEIPKCLVCVDFVEYYKIQDVAKEGEYLVYQYSERIYRKNKQTILFLETEDGQIPVCGYFLQQEINAIEDFENIQVPLVVLVGKSKTTPQKHKDRMVSLGWVKSDIPISCSIDTTEIKNNWKNDEAIYGIKSVGKLATETATISKIREIDTKKNEEYIYHKNYLQRQIADYWIEETKIYKTKDIEERKKKMQELREKYRKKEENIVETYRKLYGKQKDLLVILKEGIPTGNLQ